MKTDPVYQTSQCQKVVEVCDDTEPGRTLTTRHSNSMDITDKKDVKLFGVRLSDESWIQKTMRDCTFTDLELSSGSHKRETGWYHK